MYQHSVSSFSMFSSSAAKEPEASNWFSGPEILFSGTAVGGQM